jgi:voltage-gated potassium channel
MEQRKDRKKRIFDIIQIGQREDVVSRAFDIFIVAVIVANIAVLFLETFEQMRPYYDILYTIETVTVLIFCVEYLLRIWTAQYLYPGLSKKRAVLHFLVSFDGLVDLFTILPFFFLSGFVAFRMLRVVRIFHLFRLNASYDSFNVITSVLYEKKNQIISSVFIIFVLMLASSLCMYSAEYEAQPDVFNNAFSGMWWSISTILTVGYGDIYPVTTLGRMMAIVIALLGVGVVAIPTGIISAGFVEQYTRMQKEKETDQPGRVKDSIVVKEAGKTIGQTVKELEQVYSGELVAIVRKGAVIIPVDECIVEAEDILLFQSSEK